MSKRLPMIDPEGEVRELTSEEMRKFRPAADVLPADFLAGLAVLKKQRGARGPQKTPTKVPTTIRFDAEVLAALKASGRGWQTRVNQAMKEWLKSRSPA